MQTKVLDSSGLEQRERFSAGQLQFDTKQNEMKKGRMCISKPFEYLVLSCSEEASALRISTFPRQLLLVKRHGRL